MKKFIIKNIISNLIILFIVITLNFFLPRMIFDDPCEPYYIGVPEDAVLLRAQIREEYGFDKPIIVQYFIYLKNIFTFNFGTSYIYKDSIINVMFSKMPWSVFINLTVLLLTVFFGILIGAKCALNRGKFKDRLLLKLNSITSSIPSFWIALVAVLVFGFILPIFPYSGAMSPGYSLNVNWVVFIIIYSIIIISTIVLYLIFKKGIICFLLPILGLYIAIIFSISALDLVDIIYHSILPICVVLIGSIISYSLSIRNYMIAVVNEDYIFTARAKGLPKRRILYHHILKNSMLPLVTNLGLSFVGLFSGSVLIEKIFSWPGMGNLMVEANNLGDFKLVQALLLFYAVLTILANFITDILYHKLDPRVSVM